MTGHLHCSDPHSFLSYTFGDMYVTLENFLPRYTLPRLRQLYHVQYFGQYLASPNLCVEICNSLLRVALELCKHLCKNVYMLDLSISDKHGIINFILYKIKMFF